METTDHLRIQSAIVRTHTFIHIKTARKLALLGQRSRSFIRSFLHPQNPPGRLRKSIFHSFNRHPFGGFLYLKGGDVLAESLHSSFLCRQGETILVPVGIPHNNHRRESGRRLHQHRNNGRVPEKYGMGCGLSDIAVFCHAQSPLMKKKGNATGKS